VTGSDKPLIRDILYHFKVHRPQHFKHGPGTSPNRSTSSVPQTSKLNLVISKRSLPAHPMASIVRQAAFRSAFSAPVRPALLLSRTRRLPKWTPSTAFHSTPRAALLPPLPRMSGRIFYRADSANGGQKRSMEPSTTLCLSWTVAPLTGATIGVSKGLYLLVRTPPPTSNMNSG
jgi:hypothetical protein